MKNMWHSLENGVGENKERNTSYILTRIIIFTYIYISWNMVFSHTIHPRFWGIALYVFRASIMHEVIIAADPSTKAQHHHVVP